MLHYHIIGWAQDSFIPVLWFNFACTSWSHSSNKFRVFPLLTLLLPFLGRGLCNHWLQHYGMCGRITTLIHLSLCCRILSRCSFSHCNNVAQSLFSHVTLFTPNSKNMGQLPHVKWIIINRPDTNCLVWFLRIWKSFRQELDWIEWKGLGLLTRSWSCNGQTPFYKRNRSHICSFIVQGNCTHEAECLFCHEMSVTEELSQQNILEMHLL